MTLVKKALSLPEYVMSKGDLGVEIEVEGDDLPYRGLRHWNVEEDGSLRGESREYVLAKPMLIDGVRTALNELNSAYIDKRTTVHESVRAGVHVHVNVQDLTTVELFSFMTAYIILEELLVKWCGEYREGNLFCLRMKDAEWLLRSIEDTAKDKDYHRFAHDNLRYASMNVTSLYKFGSLEFRAMRGTRDLDLIFDWASMLLNLRNTAIKYTPDQIVVMTPESFLETLLGTNKEQVCNGVAYEEVLSDGFSRAYPLAMNTDWDTFSNVNIGGLMFPAGTEFPNEPLEDM